MQFKCPVSFSPLYHIIHLRNFDTNTSDDLQLDTNERKMYHDTLVKLTSQVNIDWLHNLHFLDDNEDGDTSWTIHTYT
jgi:hypothetical protein